MPDTQPAKLHDMRSWSKYIWTEVHLCMQECRTSTNGHILCRQSIMYISEIFRYSQRACLSCNGLISTQPGKDIAVLPVPKHHVT